MITVQTDLPPGTIIMPTGEACRYPQAWMSLISLQTPPNTQLYVPIGHALAANLNEGIRNMTGEWVMIMGDDHVYAPDLLLRMLSHQRDVIAPLCAKRRPPFDPVILGDKTQDGLWAQGDWANLKAPNMLYEVKVASMAGMVIRRHVLEKVGDPWFEIGKIKPDQLTEDGVFQDKIRAAGFQILVDPSVTIGHYFLACVWPKWDGEKWGPQVDLGDHKLVELGLGAELKPVGDKVRSPLSWGREFDDYRAKYDTMTFEEKRTYSEWLYDFFPLQGSFTPFAVRKFLGRVGEAVPHPRIVEIGGWRGDLAGLMLPDCPHLREWTNIEMTLKAAAQQNYRDPRYRVLVQEHELWETPLPEGDACIVSHVIEHMKAPELVKFLGALKPYEWLYLEAPLPKSAVDEKWAGYIGTHVLEWGWEQVRLFLARDYTVEESGGEPNGWLILRRRP